MTLQRASAPPSSGPRSWPQRCRARAALAADRKTDLAIALHTLIAAAEPLLDTRASQEPPPAAERQVSEAPPADD